MKLITLTLYSSLALAGYEAQLVQNGLERNQLQRELSPEGKVVEAVFIYIDDVLSPSDPIPMFFNNFHKLTRDSVIERELLFKRGEVFSENARQETERNLRRLFFVALAQVIPVRTPEGKMALLVATKDKWSLRLSNNFTLIGSLLQFLQLQLTEVNFNGWGQELALSTQVKLDTISLGQSFQERRLFGSRFRFGEQASLIFNRKTFALEGTNGLVYFARPLISLNQSWGFSSYFSWSSRTARTFRGTEIWQVPITVSDVETTVPFVHPVRNFQGEISGTKRWGDENKFDVTVALGAYTRNYIPGAESKLTEQEIAALVSTWLPRSESATVATLKAQAFSANYVVLHNIDAFELSEDFQLGFRVIAGARVAIPNPLTPLSFVELAGSARYRFYAGDNLFTASVAGEMRIRPNDTLANRRFTAEIVNYSPKFEGGRFVTRILIDSIVNDLNNRQLFLGGSDGLRGTSAEEFSGKNQLLGNFEYRFRPLSLLSTSLGLVAFYDVGAAYNSQPKLTHSAGMGIRWLIPQFNNEVIRIDFGVVMGGTSPGLDRLNATWGQVTNLRPSFLDDPL
jgi:hypothetical protein